MEYVMLLFASVTFSVSVIFSVRAMNIAEVEMGFEMTMIETMAPPMNASTKGQSTMELRMDS